MKIHYLSLETVKLAQSKGINIYQDIHVTSLTYFSDGRLRRIKGEGEFPTVSQSIMYTWLREKHKLHIVIMSDSKFKFYYRIYSLENLNIPKTGNIAYEKWESCMEKAIQECLKLL